MRRLYVILIIVIVTLIVIATIVIVPTQHTAAQWAAAILLGILSSMAAVAEIVGLLDRFKPSSFKRSKPSTPRGDFTKPLPKIQAQMQDLQIVRRVSETGLSSVFVAQRPNGDTFLLKQRSKRLVCGLNYSKVKLDLARFAIPEAVWQDDQFIYEVIPYREGWSLAEIVELNEGGIGGQLIKSWAFELLELLEALHTHKPPIIHRDLKPENVLVIPGTLRLVLLDLTSAVIFEPGSTYDPLGTDGYVPPEQVQEKPTPASDLYALAATLFKMNSGIDPPGYFDRERGKANLSLVKVDTRVARFFPFIAKVNPAERPENAQVAVQIWHKCTPGTFSGWETLKPIKLPSGDEIPQQLWIGGGSTSVSI